MFEKQRTTEKNRAFENHLFGIQNVALILSENAQTQNLVFLLFLHMDTLCSVEIPRRVSLIRNKTPHFDLSNIITIL